MPNNFWSPRRSLHPSAFAVEITGSARLTSPALGRKAHMKNLPVRLLVCLVLATASVAFILIGIRWLLFVGLGCAALASFCSRRQIGNPPRYLALVICSAGFVLDFVESVRDGDVFGRKPLEVWWWVILIAAWLWIVVDELRLWRPKGGTATAS
jgi:hypothetical protein